MKRSIPDRSAPTAAPSGAVEHVAALGGVVLSVLINRVYGRGRPRPLHPRGEARNASWTIDTRGPSPTGVPCLDDLGQRPCQVRHSRAVGLPSGWPDIEGVAVRLPRGSEGGGTGGGMGENNFGGDLLLAGTGDGMVSRHLLVPRRSEGTCSTLLPMRTPTGPLLVRLRPAGSEDWEIAWSRPGGAWHRVGTLTVTDEPVPEPHFEPVDSPPHGLEHYPVAALLRRPSYAQARRQAGLAEADDPVPME